MEARRYAFRPLIHTSKLIQERLRIRLGSIGLHLAQAQILAALDRLGEASQADLARAFDLSPASMSAMTGRLLKAGLIERRVDPHELRSNIITLTNKGRGQLGAIYQQWRATNNEISELIGADKAEQFTRLALELRNALGGSAVEERQPNHKKERAAR